jgi:hypothetical protein
MSMPESSLPERWVDRIFAVMRASYGARFDRQWECPVGIDPADFVRDLKAIWGRELARFQQSPKAIEVGLDNLPEHPPTLPEFRALCARRPDVLPRALPAPKNPPPQGVLQRVASVGQSRRDARAWAHVLRERHRRGEQLTQFQVACYEEALAHEAHGEAA